MRGFISSVVAVASLLSTAAADVNNPIDPIVIKGSKFFYKTNGTQFFMRGVAYQEDITANGTGTGNVAAAGYKDPLADEAACRRDVPLLVQLKTNVIRTYRIDPKANHDVCMQLLNDAGIYVISDLSEPKLSINRDDPKWNIDLYNRYTAVVDALAPYSNVVGFFAGNEVSNAKNNTPASAFVKAAVRDTKAYIKSKNYRAIGVGYATNDDADIRQNMADYFNCGDQSSAIDFWGYNIYSWCGDSSFEKSGFDVQTRNFEKYSVPVFFAEYGCNTVGARKFTEVGALYGSQMTPVWSGGIVYMYFQEANNYGLVSVSGNTVSKLSDFSALSSQMAKATPTGVTAGSYNPSNSPAACPATGADWAAPTALPPTPNAQLCSCMNAGLTCYASSSIQATDLGKLFGQVCGYPGNACAGINTNVSQGAFGAYGMCSPTDQLSWAFNAYYQSQRGAADACNFGQAGSTKASSAPASSCSSLLSQAGTNGQGTVTSAPQGGGSSSGGGGGGNAGSAVLAKTFSLGYVNVGLSVCVAALSGVLMLVL